MTRPVLLAIAVCLLGLTLEAICAGKGVRERMVSLRSPSYSMPFRAWISIGAVYYAICFIVLTRLLLLSLRSAVAFTLLGGVMILNAVWNVFFFRTCALRQAFYFGIGYSAVAIALLVLLFKCDLFAAWCFAPYVVYLLYANVWGYWVWKLNLRTND